MLHALSLPFALPAHHLECLQYQRGVSLLTFLRCLLPLLWDCSAVVALQSADYDPHHPGTVRRDGSYIYEEFLTTGGTDVKVYTVGPR